MFRKSTLLTALVALVGVASADYAFPSVNPPGGKTPAQVKQFVTFIWDDNGYSGETGSMYEYKTGTIPWPGSVIGGPYASDDALKLKEGEMGLSWAVNTLAAGKPIVALKYPLWTPSTQGPGGTTFCAYEGKYYSASYWVSPGEIPGAGNNGWVATGETYTAGGAATRKNPDGTDVSMTFNVITGLFIPTWDLSTLGWQDRTSKYGHVKGNNGFVSGTSGHQNIAIAWGREQQIGSSQGGSQHQAGWMIPGFTKARTAGHEIGNHTIDHMESNSPMAPPTSSSIRSQFTVKIEMFQNWATGNSNEDGFDYSDLDSMPWGTVYNEATEFGSSGNALTMGWKMYAGKYISKSAWSGAIALAWDELLIALPGIQKSAFRAPRLEVNSAMFYALKEGGYEYDCGLEEGYEYHRDGTNFIWPYTTDNGAVNTWTQKSWGENISIDTMPTGFWQIPVNVMIVPENIRQAVWNNANDIATATGAEMEPFADWSKTGKITGFDFNMFILWGMTQVNAEATLKNTLDLRMAGNKAPMQIGCHTDYFTPIYDYQTLLSPFNANKYGLVVSRGWNTWVDRKTTFDNFISYALGKGAYLVSGAKLLDSIRAYQAGEVVAPANNLVASWELIKDDLGTTGGASPTGSLANITINMAAKQGDNYPYAGYQASWTVGQVVGLTHVEMDYKSNAPLRVTLRTSGGLEREVLLNHYGSNTVRNSGKIPLGAFEQSQYDSLTIGYQPTISGDDIVGMYIAPLTVGDKAETINFSVENIKLYATSVTPINGGAIAIAKPSSAISLAGMQANALKLNVGTAGKYTVSIFTANGRLVKSFENTSLKAGANTLSTASLSTGVYMIRVNGLSNKISKSFSAVVR